MVKFAVTFVIANIFCIFVFVMYKEDSFNTVSPSELGPFWGDVKSEDFFLPLQNIAVYGVLQY